MWTQFNPLMWKVQRHIHKISRHYAKSSADFGWYDYLSFIENFHKH
jgi:hypothetical protein